MTKNIDELIRTAIKSKNKAALTGYRAVKAKIMLEKTKPNPSETSDDQLLLNAAAKEIKERQEASKLYADPNHQIVLENNQIVDYLKSLLPKALTKQEQEKLICDIIVRLKPDGLKDLGKVMGQLTQYKTTIDMQSAVQFVKSKLAPN